MKPKHSSSDIINDLPEIIIETILCLIPIRDAVRTSILSKKWRYNWNKIPKLVFNEEDVFNKLQEKHRVEEDEENNEDDEEYNEEDDEENTENEVLTGKYKFFYAIHQILLMHQGSIIEFSLSMKSNYKCVELDQIITYLSRKNTVKKLTLELNGYDSTYELPFSFFSLRQLTHLYLQCCDLRNHQPTVDGFGMLTSLFINNVDITDELILHIVSKYPLLKSFSLVLSDSYTSSRAPMCKLFGYIPAIEDLYLAIRYCHSDRFKLSLLENPTPLVHLKYVHLLAKCLTGRYGLPFAVFLIRSSPNLEKLKLQSFHRYNDKSGIDALTEKKYSDIWLEHLKEVELFVSQRIPELEFLKLILARSPMLKEVTIIINYAIDKDAEIEMLRVLSYTPRASNMVEIIVERLDGPESPTDDEG